MARRSPARSFSRTDRIGEAIRSIVAGELERLDDDRLGLVTVTGVRVDGDLSHADVYYSALVAGQEGRLDEVAEALDELRWRIQKVVNRQIHARRTPQIEFHPDEVLAQALHIDDLIEGRAASPAEPDE